MRIAIIGLGRMGNNIALHLLEQGVSVVGYSRTREKVDMLVSHGAIGANSLGELVQKLTATDAESTNMPVIVFLFVPAGTTVDELLFGVRARAGNYEKDAPRELVQRGLADLLPAGSIIVDGGNSFYKDSQERYRLLKEKGLHFLDMGTSGGIDGARSGACLMIGGDRTAYTRVEPLFRLIAQPEGYGYFGSAGAGHYVKMIHNAVEYGMMGAIAEGFNLISNFQFPISNTEVARVWAHGSIVSGHLMNMAVRAFSREDFEQLSGAVPRGETEVEMEWLEMTGISHPVIQQSRKQRVETRTNPSFIGKVIAALRREFGGHSVR